MQFEKVKAMHQEDFRQGYGNVEWPHRLAKKISQRALRDRLLNLLMMESKEIDEAVRCGNKSLMSILVL